MLSMFKLKSKKKKFTLTELLLAIGIITLLAVVIIPKIGAVKDNAKTAGVDTNMRLVQGYVESVLHNYDSTQSDLLEKELESIFTGDNAIMNPFTKGEGVAQYSGIPSQGVAISYETSDTSKSAVTSNWEIDNSDSKLKGTIVIAAYPNPNGSDTLEVTVLPHDKNGNPIMSKKTVLQP